jgi:glycosyltransferase involved in cell wall biosynthesis
MLAETAIVACGIDACQEVLGDTARFFDPGDIGELRESLTVLIENTDERRRLAASSRERVLKMFTWDSVGERFFELLSRYSRE